MDHNRENFTFVGYDIRKKWKYVDKEIKVSLQHELKREISFCYSVDVYIRERHESIMENDWDKIGKSKSWEGMYYYYKDILELYNQIDEKIRSQYEIIGYAVENNKLDIAPQGIKKEDNFAEGGYFSYAKKKHLTISEKFCPIGFDVITMMYEWISAITNCGLFKRKEGKKFLEKLNLYNLFDFYADALHFQNFSDENIPEHSPFVVWQIYQLRSNQGHK